VLEIDPEETKVFIRGHEEQIARKESLSAGDFDSRQLRRERSNSSVFGGAIRWHLAVCRLVWTQGKRPTKRAREGEREERGRLSVEPHCGDEHDVVAPSSSLATFPPPSFPPVLSTRLPLVSGLVGVPVVLSLCSTRARGDAGEEGGERGREGDGGSEDTRVAI